MSNMCERCGGQKTVYYKIEPIYANGYTSAAHAITASTLKICMCHPESGVKPEKSVKDRLGEICAYVYWKYLLPSRGEENARWQDVYHRLYELCLDVEDNA